MAFVPQLELEVRKHFSDNWALSIFVCTVAIFDFKRRGKMGRVVNAINEACIFKGVHKSLSSHSLLPQPRPQGAFPHLHLQSQGKAPWERGCYSLWLVHQTLWTWKYLGLNNLCSEYENILYIIVVSRAGFLTTNYLHALRILGIASRSCIVSPLLFTSFHRSIGLPAIVADVSIIVLAAFGKKKPTFFWQQNEEWCSHHDQYWSSTWAGDQKLLSKAS